MFTIPGTDAKKSTGESSLVRWKASAAPNATTPPTIQGHRRSTWAANR